MCGLFKQSTFGDIDIQCESIARPTRAHCSRASPKTSGAEKEKQREPSLGRFVCATKPNINERRWRFRATRLALEKATTNIQWNAEH